MPAHSKSRYAPQARKNYSYGSYDFLHTAEVQKGNYLKYNILGIIDDKMRSNRSHTVSASLRVSRCLMQNGQISSVEFSHLWCCSSGSAINWDVFGVIEQHTVISKVFLYLFQLSGCSLGVFLVYRHLD